MRHVKVTREVYIPYYTVSCYSGDNLIQQHQIPDDFDHIGKFVRIITEWLGSTD